jgi:hypothetical protein
MSFANTSSNWSAAAASVSSAPLTEAAPLRSSPLASIAQPPSMQMPMCVASIGIARDHPRSST